MTLTVILSLGMTQTLQAQPKHLPKGERINPGTATEKECFALPEYKKLLSLDNNYTLCQETHSIDREQLYEQGRMIAELRRIIELKEDNELILKKENERIFQVWKADNKKLHIAENETSISTWLGWSVAGVAVATSAGLLTALIVKD